jgi:hypothetical protein
MIFQKTPKNLEFFSWIEPKIGYNHAGQHVIYARIYQKKWYGAKWLKTIYHYFKELDEHEEAIRELSKRAYNSIQDIYKYRAVIDKMMANNAINNALEIFAKQLTDLYK